MGKIIGVCGVISSGKGTLSSYLVDQYDFVEVSFASAVKDVLSVMFGWDRTLLDGSTKESRNWRNIKDEYWSLKFGHDVTPRWAMQNVGTDLVRNHFHVDFWVLIVEKFIYTHPNKNIVISDCRFHNEIDMITEVGGTIIEVQPAVLPEWYHIAHSNNNPGVILRNEDYGVHISEWGWIGYNKEAIVIRNDSSISDLHKKIDITLLGIL